MRGSFWKSRFYFYRPILKTPEKFIKKDWMVITINKVKEGLDFFLDAVIETAQESIVMSKKITTLEEDEMRIIQALGKREAESSVSVLKYLFKNPIVTSGIVANFTGYTGNDAQKVIDGFIDIDILKTEKSD